jgi:hypothetical protein
MQDTAFLDDMRIERTDYTFPNGAVGVIVSYIMEERERVKIVDTATARASRSSSSSAATSTTSCARRTSRSASTRPSTRR